VAKNRASAHVHRRFQLLAGTNRAINVVVKLTNQHATTAAESYTARLADSQDLLARIAVALESHHARQEAKPYDWGHASELGGVNEKLAYVLAMLGDRSAVDAKSLDY